MTNSGETHFDLVIIGTGSGNSILDERFEDWKVAIIERDVFGGTCLNRGCVPTKMLVRPADIVTNALDAGRLGVDLSLDGVRWLDIRDRIFGRIDPLVADGERYRRSQPHVQVFAGDAQFVGPKRLEVTDSVGRADTFTGDRFVVAAGARPMIPPAVESAGVAFHTSDTIMRIDELPDRLVIVGGGFIAAEMAHVFGAFGVEVSVVTRGAKMLSHHDHDIAHRFTTAMLDRFDGHLESTVIGVSEHRGRVLVAVKAADGMIRKVEGDMLLIATGRIPNSDQLRLDLAKVKLNDEGFVHTDATLETTVPGVFALGDIRTPMMLKHVANHEARVVQHNLLNPTRPMRIDERVVPHAVFGHPEVAAVGLTEAEARMTQRRIGVGIRPYSDTAYGWALEDETSICKVIADLDTREILGAHIIGPQASTIIQQPTQGMQFGLTVDQLATGQMYPHPALSEVFEQALLAIDEQN